jgi:FAD/FMN-containing dehydrogenase
VLPSRVELEIVRVIDTPEATHIRAIELVTACGRSLRADRDHEPDLFWALRGGGGSFAIVTAIEVELFPVTQAYAGLLWYPIERAGDVLHAWRELTQADPPDEFTTTARLMNFPVIPQVPDPLRGKSFAVIDACHLGERTHADELLAPLRSLGPGGDVDEVAAQRGTAGFGIGEAGQRPGGAQQVAADGGAGEPGCVGGE